MSNYRVAIIGAGPVGLLCALGLARKGVDSVVIEREPGVVDSPRAIAHHWSTLPGMDELGILDKAIARGFAKNDFALKVHKTGEEIRWNLDVLQGHVKFPFNVYLPQHILADVILEELAAYPGTRVLWGTTFAGLRQTDKTVTISLQNDAEGAFEMNVEWLVGADGARSAVRKALGVGFDGFTWDQQFVATNIRIDLSKHGYARSLLLVDKPNGAVLAMIDNENLWRCAYAEDSGLPAEGVVERIHAMLPRIIPEARDGYALEHHSVYRIHQRNATEFRVGRVLLAGDAAHATNPAGGFGLTTGCLDVFILYEALAAILGNQAPVDILDTYARERKRVFLEFTSPQATRLMKLLLQEEGLQEGLERFRLLATDESARLKYSLFAGNLETPSLVTGRRHSPQVAA
ncbi:NAD(P)/FAD-dependent oxidoreductase [Frigidibacter sp.]|uniref:FAD-dependent oxidoreductase n=1 Tax=Frigidibacter sp. TaxID=2586418 RepID=UPI002733CB48|nr:FAD-dependent monooxygenase [Frigidibacter sp.]MDP3339306.1 FAD-dependent monooxygenase [Frigidibacter sp.]